MTMPHFSNVNEGLASAVKNGLKQFTCPYWVYHSELPDCRIEVKTLEFAKSGVCLVGYERQYAPGKRMYADITV